MPTADERLALIRVKVERAKEHIRNLKVELDSFIVTNPYIVGTKHDPQTGNVLHYLASVRDTPIRVAVIASDVLQNLRSALDHLAYQLVIVSGGTPTKQTYFPISGDAAKYKTEAPGKVKGMRQGIIKAIDAVKPYHGGDDLLWRLHRLNIVDKHRALITVGSAYQSLNVGGFIFEQMHRQLSSDPAWNWLSESPPLDAFFAVKNRMFPLKKDAILFTDKRPDAKLDDQMQFRFEIAFGEPQVAEGEPLFDTLSGIADRVDDILVSFKPFLG